MRWQPVIGLEIHAQLATQSKLFSGSSTQFGAEPNRHANLIDLGFPGVLPVINYQAVIMAIKFGLAINAHITQDSVFARKNYFYPDLPKGYQISQYDKPIVADGWIDIEVQGTTKRVGITRAHLEEDAGKSVHDLFPSHSGIDLNRAGTPLLEVVSEPDLRTAEEATAYMRKIHSLVRYLEICDGNMQEGSFRCDANVSVRPADREELGIRTELKNINSFRFVERAILYEIERQIEVLESGGEVVQETRLYDAEAGHTRAMREKEEANDYRYFPDPDLLPMRIDTATIDELRESLPELPDKKLARFVADYSLNDYDAAQLVAERDTAAYFEETVAASRGEAKLAANWILSELGGALKRSGTSIADSPVSPQQLGKILTRISDKTISSKIAKQVFEILYNEGGDADRVIASRGLEQVSDTGALEALVDAVIAENPDQVAQFKAGKAKLMGFFVGRIMSKTGGKADPVLVNTLLAARLKD